VLTFVKVALLPAKSARLSGGGSGFQEIGLESIAEIGKLQGGQSSLSPLLRSAPPPPEQLCDENRDDPEYQYLQDLSHPRISP